MVIDNNLHVILHLIQHSDLFGIITDLAAIKESSSLFR